MGSTIYMYIYIHIFGKKPKKPRESRVSISSSSRVVLSSLKILQMTHHQRGERKKRKRVKSAPQRRHCVIHRLFQLNKAHSPCLTVALLMTLGSRGKAFFLILFCEKKISGS